MSLSYWERQTMLHCDHLIIGGGITGLSVACELLERNPKQRVVLMERGLLPSGASTKNAGFACTGSLSEHVYDRTLMGEERWLQLVSNRKLGLELLTQRVGKHAMQYEQHGGFELVMQQQDQQFMNEMDAVNHALQPLYGRTVFELQNERIANFGFSHKVQHLIANSTEGQIHTGATMLRLWQYAQSLGALIHTGANVSSIESEGSVVNVSVNDISFRADTVYICTNAFTKKFLPHADLQPGRGQVLITKPIPNLKLKGIFFYEEGFYYFKNQDERVLLGGGRNLDISGETTTEFGEHPQILEKLNELLHEVILPGVPFEIDQTWSGIMAFGGNKTPLLEKIDDRVFVAARLNGMGVALGSKIARDLVELAQR